MKKTLTLVGLGASVLLAFPSCKSTDSDGFEEALPMSYVSDDENAPWDENLDWLDDAGGSQVSAGDVTMLPPAPDEPEDDSTGKVSARQNRPKVAANDVVTEDSPFGGIDPLSGAPVTEQHTAVTPPPTTPKKTAGTSTGKPSTTKTASTKKPAGKKPSKKLSKPTLVVYKVRKGDNLSSIAKRSGTTVAQIRKDSGIKGDLIHPGQTIKVRFTPKDYKAPETSKGNKGGKASKNNKGKTSTTPAKGSKTYTVRNGETISGIAKKNGVSTSALLKANGMSASDAAKMRVGRKLVIPKN